MFATGGTVRLLYGLTAAILLLTVADMSVIEAEVEVDETDIPFVKVGQPVRIKLTAYDYSIFGSLKGHITNISADSVSKEERGQLNYYYIARIETSTKAIQSLEKNLPIIPGMQAQVDIITGNKTNNRFASSEDVMIAYVEQKNYQFQYLHQELQIPYLHLVLNYMLLVDHEEHLELCRQLNATLKFVF